MACLDMSAESCGATNRTTRGRATPTTVRLSGSIRSAATTDPAEPHRRLPGRRVPAIALLAADDTLQGSNPASLTVACHGGRVRFRSVFAYHVRPAALLAVGVAALATINQL